MLPSLRPRAALLVLVGLGGALAPGLFSSGCGPEPIGVESCRRIEGARCEAAASCGFTAEDVADCKLIYTDQCLHGIENKGHRPIESETEACMAAISAAGACAEAGVAKISACPDAPLAAGAADDSPCVIVLSVADHLEACAFVAIDGDAGTVDASADADGQ